jgi:hypothetical protein
LAFAGTTDVEATREPIAGRPTPVARESRASVRADTPPASRWTNSRTRGGATSSATCPSAPTAPWSAGEHAAYGFELPPTRDRFDRFAEQVAIAHGSPVRRASSPSRRYYRLAGVSLSTIFEVYVALLLGTEGDFNLFATH